MLLSDFRVLVPASLLIRLITRRPLTNAVNLVFTRGYDSGRLRFIFVRAIRNSRRNSNRRLADDLWWGANRDLLNYAGNLNS